MTASTHSDWRDLVAALSREIELVRALRDLSAAGREPLARIDVPNIQRWVEEQRNLLANLEDATRERQNVQNRLLPEGAAAQQAVFGFRAMIESAPAEFRDDLVRQHQDLRSLRDEVVRSSGRNEAMCRQVLSFTEQVGRNLVERREGRSYQQLGLRASFGRFAPQQA